MLKFLAVVATLAFVFVADPMEVEAQQIAIPPCPSDADCHFRGSVHERESFRSWNNGGGYPYPPYTGGPYYSGGGGDRYALGLTFNFGGGHRRDYSHGQRGGYQSHGPAVATQCAPNEIRQGNICSGCRPGLVFVRHPQTGQLICVRPH